jgi:hypothetical protein
VRPCGPGASWPETSQPAGLGLVIYEKFNSNWFTGATSRRGRPCFCFSSSGTRRRSVWWSWWQAREQKRWLPRRFPNARPQCPHCAVCPHFLRFHRLRRKCRWVAGLPGLPRAATLPSPPRPRPWAGRSARSPAARRAAGRGPSRRPPARRARPGSDARGCAAARPGVRP